MLQRINGTASYNLKANGTSINAVSNVASYSLIIPTIAEQSII
jgi:hypothetical protein